MSGVSHKPVVFFLSPASSACSGTSRCLERSASRFSPSGPYERLPPHCRKETPLHWTAATERDTVGDVRAQMETDTHIHMPAIYLSLLKYTFVCFYLSSPKNTSENLVQSLPMKYKSFK